MNEQERSAGGVIGSIIGGYRILGVIGHGSTGTVYRAEVPASGELVAFKRITVHTEEQQRVDLHNEAKALVSISHPSVLRLIEVVDTPEHLALVTEFLDGGSLRDVLRSHGPYSSSETVALLAPIAAALGEAHRKGLIHRDIKPSNILLRADGSTVLADFGLAIDDPTMSKTNAALGSAAYLDPMVLDGAKPSVASDVYSLGVVAYELLRGTPPFTGESTLAVMRASDRGIFSPLSRFEHGPLADEVERAFARRSDDRFDSATDLLRAWQRAIDPGTVQALTGKPPSQVLSASVISTLQNSVSMGSSATPAPISPPDRGAASTTSFSSASRPAALWDATPVTPTRKWGKMAGVAAGIVAVAALGAGVAIKREQNSKQELSGIVPFKVFCDSTRTAQCVESFTRTPDGISVKFSGDAESTRFAVGGRNDALRVSNFFCGTAETLALYRPTTGVIYYFREWPLPSAKTEVRADATGIINAEVIVADFNTDNCGDIGLEQASKRTWFSPSTQTERLKLVALGDTE
jgi:serine/threonine protein kinase